MVTNSEGAVGIFDSGIGGLTVLSQVIRLLPRENLLYFADQVNIPYGSRSSREIRRLSLGISRFLLKQGAKLIVVACNTASAAALTYLRSSFPGIPFVGMEPAVKPGVAKTRNGRVGVLATPGTFSSDRYANLMARFAQNVIVFEDPCQGLVEQIEAGHSDAFETERILRDALSPMLAAGVDSLVLGCTHYPFVLPLIQRLAGPDVAVVDPAPAVARQVQRILRSHKLDSQARRPGAIQSYSTGDAVRLESVARQYLGQKQELAVAAVSWRSGGSIAF